MNATPPLTVHVATRFADCPITQSEWDDAVARMGGPIYMTLDWLKTWWDFYGDGRELRLLVFTLDDEVVGLLPIYLDCLGIWPLQLRIARLVGSNIPPKVFDPPLALEHAERCLELGLRTLLEDDDSDVISLGPISGAYSPWHKIKSGCLDFPFKFHLATVPCGLYTVFRLPPRIEEYHDSLARTERKKRSYEWRRLEKELSAHVDVLSGPAGDVTDEFERFAVQHAAQWQAEGKPGHFGSWPHGLEFNRALVAAQSPLGRVRFIRILAGDQVVSNQYAFAFGDRWWWELPSRNVGEKWDRLSLGPAGLLTMIGEAINQGVKQIEGGLGHYEYKLRLKAEEHPVLLYRVASSRPGSRLRQQLFGGLRWLLSIGYHKLWYRRIQPKLPSKWRRPQWRLWLRFDY